MVSKSPAVFNSNRSYDYVKAHGSRDGVKANERCGGVEAHRGIMCRSPQKPRWCLITRKLRLCQNAFRPSWCQHT